MNKINDNEARLLMEQFLDGSTSTAMEQQLYDYFSGKTLPPDLEQYREMMNWYASLAPRQQSAKKTRRLRLPRWAAIAASFAVIIAVAIPLYRDYETRRDLLATYEGSYIIRDGVRYDYIPEIINELNEADAYVASVSNAFSGDIVADELRRMLSDDVEINKNILSHFEQPN